MCNLPLKKKKECQFSCNLNIILCSVHRHTLLLLNYFQIFFSNVLMLVNYFEILTLTLMPKIYINILVLKELLYCSIHILLNSHLVSILVLSKLHSYVV